MVAKGDTAEIIERFLSEVNKRITVEKAVLFGSYVKGKPDKDSDIDIAIVSSDFYGLKPIKRLTLLGKIAWDAHTTKIEAFGWTPEEYNSASVFDFLYEIRQNGEVLV